MQCPKYLVKKDFWQYFEADMLHLDFLINTRQNIKKNENFVIKGMLPVELDTEIDV